MSADRERDLEEPLLPSHDEVLAEDHTSVTGEEASVDSPRKFFYASLALIFVSFLFATLNVSLRHLYTMSPAATPPQVNATRGWFTVLFFLPLLMTRKGKQDAANTTTTSTASRPLWMAAGELALWNFGGQVLVNVGLLTTPSARAAFLGQTIIVLVPLICVMTGGRDVLKKKELLGCFCSMIGVVLLSTASPDAGDASTFHLHIGDVCVLASAICFACYLIRISDLALHYDEVFLQGSKNTIMALLYSLWLVGSILANSEDSIVPQWAKSSWTAWLVIAYTAFGPGCMADLLQQKAQEIVPPTQSNLILCSSSVFTAILGRILLGEETSGLENLGGAFLIAGAVVAGSTY